MGTPLRQLMMAEQPPQDMEVDEGEVTANESAPPTGKAVDEIEEGETRWM